VKDVSLQAQRRRWLCNRRLLWAFGGIAAGGLCTLLIPLYLAYRQGRIEQEVVAALLSKSPGGFTEVDDRPGWRNRLYETLGIPRPVTGLFLEGNQVKDEDLAKLDSLKHLTLLSLDQCPITDEGVKEIVKVRTLESVSLFFCNEITDTGLTYLGSKKSLTALHISTDSDRISGRGIHSLSAIPHLEILDLNSCSGISDDAVEPLASLNRLVNLDIRGTSISGEGVNRLRRALPNTIVLTDY